jgi:hypothetical protein
VTHVVACDFQATAHSTHETRVHGAETPKVDSVRQFELRRRLLQMAMKQVMAVERLTNFVREHQVIWFAEFPVPLPHDLDRAEDHAMTIKRDLALSRFRFHIIELIVVDSSSTTMRSGKMSFHRKASHSPTLIEANTVKMRRHRVGSTTSSITLQTPA